MSLLSREYRGIRKVSGPLLFVESASDLPYAGTVRITGPAGAPRNGQVIEVSDEVTVVQVFEDTMGLDAAHTSLSLVDREALWECRRTWSAVSWTGQAGPVTGCPA